MLARVCFVLLALLVASGMFLTAAEAQPLTHPVWAATPSSSWDAAARVQFEAALKSRGLGPLEQLEGDPATATEPSLLDKEAANRAKAKGAAFVLLGRVPPGDKPEINLRLIDASSEELKDATAVDLTSDSSSTNLFDSVLRLDETARKTVLVRQTGSNGKDAPLSLAMPPPRIVPADSPKLANDAEGWFWHHWPLLTAIGTAVGTALVLGIVVAKDNR
jgi:hypothetical protein